MFTLRACARLCAVPLACLSALPALASPGVATPGIAAQVAANRVQVHPFPNAIRYSHHNDDYTVRVRVPGGAWQDLYEYNVKVDLDKPQDAAMVYFNFDGTVEMAVQKNNGTFSNVVVRPDGKGVRPAVRDGVVYFTLHRPENLSVEFDGDHLHNLHIFTHAIRADMPAVPATLTSNDIGAGTMPDMTQRTVFFGPGIHNGEFRVRSHSTVYIHGSAILRNPLLIDGVEDVKIISDGLIEGADLTVRNARNVEIDGPIFLNPPHGTMRCITSQDLVERNIRTIGAGQWSDGLGHFACERVTIADSFVRTSDDCLTFYNHRWDIWGNTRDVTVKDTTLWADIAHAVMIGIHGNTPTPAHPDSEVLERLRFSNIDILDHDEDEPEYEGALGIMAGDDNLVRDVVFEDIRVDRIEEGKLFNLKIAYTAKYNTSPGLGIENVTLRNVHYSGRGSPSASAITGRDATRKVRNVTIENVTVGGKRLAAPEAGLLDVNEFVDGLRFR
ncbi:glycoside hydrolase [Massilia sp. TW-1]|uniref:Glycoside hydrolase n=1 Tax=Telluria antibiotica TaxID=2717319 RepID=A0ABX0PFY3_9BURK|nr:glycoside hydrolase [Telluria antibiotica]NIA56037.1 glycoside hydrolase [Telluria antibiotica]